MKTVRAGELKPAKAKAKPEEAKAPAGEPAYKFRSNLMDFGPKWLADIDKLIAQGNSATDVMNWLRANYRGELGIPSLSVFRIYEKFKKTQLITTTGAAVRIRMESQKTELQLREMMGKLQISELNPDDDKVMMKSIIRFLLVRTETLSNLQDTLLDPRFEQIMGNHLTLIKDIMEDLRKIEGNLGVDAYVARRVIEMYIVAQAPIARRINDEVYTGDSRAKSFMDKFAEACASGISLMALRQEALREVEEYKRETMLGDIRSAVDERQQKNSNRKGS